VSDDFQIHSKNIKGQRACPRKVGKKRCAFWGISADTAGDFSGEIAVTASDSWQEMIIPREKLFKRHNPKATLQTGSKSPR
jgi:hypothetical protein